MEEKVYRQRRNLMITCIGIILFYMGPGNFNEIGLLKNLGLHTVESPLLKAMILLMFGYYALRYYQYSSEFPGAFFDSIKKYLVEEKSELHEQNITPVLRDAMASYSSKVPDTFTGIRGRLEDITCDGLFGKWLFTFKVRTSYIKNDPPKTTNDYDWQEHAPNLYEATGPEWKRFKWQAIRYVTIHRTGFTDWIIPWLFFWGTWAMIVWNEVICTAWQLATM